MDRWAADDSHGGVFICLCEHQVLYGDLHKEPRGPLCIDCARRIVAERAANPRWARWPGDVRCHLVGPSPSDRGWQHSECGNAATHPDGLRFTDGPRSPLCVRCVLPGVNIRLSGLVPREQPGIA